MKDEHHGFHGIKLKFGKYSFGDRVQIVFGLTIVALCTLGLLFWLYSVEMECVKFLFEPIQLVQSGHTAAAVVTSCREETRKSRARDRDFEDAWTSCKITYDNHVGQIEAAWGTPSYDALKKAVGQRISINYLPRDPSVAWVGDSGDSAWTMLVMKNGYAEAVAGTIMSVLYLTAPVALLGYLLFTIHRKKVADYRSGT